MSLLLPVLLASVQWLGPPVTSPPVRVVSLAPSLTETVLALGAGEALVGVSRFDDAPEVKGLPQVGGFADVAVEAVVALRPQLVVVQKAPGNQKPVETLARLGIPVAAFPLTTLADVGGAMATLGRVLGRRAEAGALVAELEGTRRAVRARGAARRPRVLFIYGFAPLVVAGPGSFAHELLEDCGGRNVAAKATTAYPAYSLERAVALAPDVVVDASDVREGRDAVAALPPLQRARWVQVPDLNLLRPGPRLAKGLEALCALIAPAADAGW